MSTQAFEVVLELKKGKGFSQYISFIKDNWLNNYFRPLIGHYWIESEGSRIKKEYGEFKINQQQTLEYNLVNNKMYFFKAGNFVSQSESILNEILSHNNYQEYCIRLFGAFNRYYLADNGIQEGWYYGWRGKYDEKKCGDCNDFVFKMDSDLNNDELSVGFWQYDWCGCLPILVGEESENIKHDLFKEDEVAELNMIRFVNQTSNLIKAFSSDIQRVGFYNDGTVPLRYGPFITKYFRKIPRFPIDIWIQRWKEYYKQWNIPIPEEY